MRPARSIVEGVLEHERLARVAGGFIDRSATEGGPGEELEENAPFPRFALLFPERDPFLGAAYGVFESALAQERVSPVDDAPKSHHRKPHAAAQRHAFLRDGGG